MDKKLTFWLLREDHTYHQNEATAVGSFSCIKLLSCVCEQGLQGIIGDRPLIVQWNYVIVRYCSIAPKTAASGHPRCPLQVQCNAACRKAQCDVSKRQHIFSIYLL